MSRDGRRCLDDANVFIYGTSTFTTYLYLPQLLRYLVVRCEAIHLTLVITNY